MERHKGEIVKRSKSRLVILLAMLVILSGCRLFDEKKKAASSGTESVKPTEEIVRYTGEKSNAISSVYTSKKELALTFNGMADQQTMELLLDELDVYEMKATFFLPGVRVAEEPDLANAIVSRGA
ncbi:polysaccharide deacetylase family protein [Sporosarcina sp. FSL K6-1522]|uniref:polysaccharide deacetylase family protein n=1 Tax=Sporosarcina sp. FSL K6-1522 TaxID=2921554 RepID=UPI00315B1D72